MAKREREGWEDVCASQPNSGLIELRKILNKNFDVAFAGC